MNSREVKNMCATTSQELQMLDTMATEFADSELVEGREECDEFPFKPLFDDALKKASEVGFFSLMLPEEMGGANRSMKALCTVLGEICRVDASLGGIVFTNALAQEVMMNAASLEMMARPDAEKGDLQKELLAFTPFDNPAETENHATARVEDGDYFLNGSLEYVVLGGLATRVLVPAKIEGQKELTFFLTETTREEVVISEPVVSLGLHACPAVDMEFRGAPATLVGEKGKGEEYLSQSADRLSVACAAMSAGVMRGSFLTALDYARQRLQGGREIVDWSQVRMVLADVAIKLKCADIIVEAASTAVDDAEDEWQQASRAAALHVCPIACDVTSDGIQLLGGNGYMHEYGQEKRFRDAQHLQLLLGMPPLRKLSYIERIL
jgi:alkylation response protein AidB-like acyl-CoA dehydrogenase